MARFVSGKVTTADSQAAAVAMASKSVIVDKKGVTHTFTVNKSTLEIMPGPLYEFDSPGVYFIEYGDKLLYNLENVPDNAKIVGFGSAQNSGALRCNIHRNSTGPTTRVLDYVPTPFYGQCEKQLENRLKATCKIVKANIIGRTEEMREQFFVTSIEDYTGIVQSVRYEAERLKTLTTSDNPLLIEQEKTKQKDFENQIAKEKTHQLQLELEIIKATREISTPVQEHVSMNSVLEPEPEYISTIASTYEPYVETETATTSASSVVESGHVPMNLELFVKQYCIMCTDSTEHMCRVKLIDFYNRYREVMCESNQPYVTDRDISAYLCDVLKLEKKATTWNHVTHTSFVGIQFADQEALIVKTLKDFVLKKNIFEDKNEIVDTSALYVIFIKFANSVDIIPARTNGFTLINFRKQVIKHFPTVQLKPTVPFKPALMVVEETMTMFIRDKCILGNSLCVKKVDIQAAWNKYIMDNKIDAHISAKAFYDSLLRLSPRVEIKRLGNGSLGFFGITLKLDAENVAVKI